MIKSSSLSDEKALESTIISSFYDCIVTRVDNTLGVSRGRRALAAAAASIDMLILNASINLSDIAIPFSIVLDNGREIVFDEIEPKPVFEVRNKCRRI